MQKKAIIVGIEIVEVGCIGGVCSDPECRGKGYARAALMEAHSYLFEKENISHCVLLTGEDTAPFYEKLGYKIILYPCLMKQGSENVVFDDLVLVLSRGDKLWPEGEIDLYGLPW